MTILKQSFLKNKRTFAKNVFFAFWIKFAEMVIFVL